MSILLQESPVRWQNSPVSKLDLPGPNTCLLIRHLGLFLFPLSLFLWDFDERHMAQTMSKNPVFDLLKCTMVLYIAIS